MTNLKEAKDGLYKIYTAYLLKNILGDQALKSIIDYSEGYEAILTKHLNTRLVQTTVNRLLKINPKHPLFYKYLEANIVDNSITMNLRYYLYSILEQHFPDKLDNLQDFILRYLPSYFQDIEFSDGSDIIKAGLTEFLFKTHKTLSSYFPKHKFKWNYNFNGFSNGKILILKRENNPYSEEIYPIQYLYDINDTERVIKDGIKLTQLGFALQIFKLINGNVITGLKLNFPSAPDSPIKISYENNNILIYIFKASNRLVAVTSQPKEIETHFKRSKVIDFNQKGTYIK